mmetsp:Transcript_14009/g.16967  ORF Transcript_14009/g.16967 Transcript_14009/m.16967 type:complete len:785 (+) Transcript_14009:330-2684(+)|eukprot:CAMPEP_0197847070 /NCGR_PEP_ID=MMETSP1438-20131217/5182_1 /TAXON_ID=1461541 /ORGANISM="Pterosperma sp., Strain CCMP1384" /LENGTH=784 /DNA_ID=CAMNT_0043458885 /DNA_START=330 /DNA_END=2684 /DNA_ORIENTATION=+
MTCVPTGFDLVQDLFDLFKDLALKSLPQICPTLTFSSFPRSNSTENLTSRPRSNSTEKREKHISKVTVWLLVLSVFAVLGKISQWDVCLWRGGLAGSRGDKVRGNSPRCELGSLAPVLLLKARGKDFLSGGLEFGVKDAAATEKICTTSNDPTSNQTSLAWGGGADLRMNMDTNMDTNMVQDSPRTPEALEGAYLDSNLVSPAQRRILTDFDQRLRSMVDEDGLFEGQGSLEVAVWTLAEDGGPVASLPVYNHAFGKSGSTAFHQLVNAGHFDGAGVLAMMNATVDDWLPTDSNAARDVTAVTKPYQPQMYRIASITKSVLGLAAVLLEGGSSFSLDETVHPRYLNLDTLGSAHCPGLNSTTDSEGRCAAFEIHRKQLTFRHLISHTSGLSRESKRGEQYKYGSHRSSSPQCPPEDDEFSAGSGSPGGGRSGNPQARCNVRVERNWRTWTEHSVSYVMPVCGYEAYNEASPAASCNPGEVFHYSNIGYAMLGVAMDTWLKEHIHPEERLEGWVQRNVFGNVGLKDTAWNWNGLSRSKKNRAVLGKLWNRAGVDVSKRVLMDYADHGYKVTSGSMWSTTSDLAKLVLTLDPERMMNTFGVDASAQKVLSLDEDMKRVEHDSQSEEDSWQMPGFRYGYGWYIRDDYTCLAEEEEEEGASSLNGRSAVAQSDVQRRGKRDARKEYFLGSWGSIPGYTSYVMTNQNAGEVTGEEDGLTGAGPRYAVVILRSYNDATNVDIGNQARRLLWRLLNADVAEKELKCPVCHMDQISEGDWLVDSSMDSRYRC